jgi:hypothetical protein
MRYDLGERDGASFSKPKSRRPAFQGLRLFGLATVGLASRLKLT